MILLNDGSRQKEVWGADWVPSTQSVEFDAIINIRPQQQNFSMTIQDLGLRMKVEAIIRKLLEGV
jgi:hypothetical protein